MPNAENTNCHDAATHSMTYAGTISEQIFQLRAFKQKGK
jgi:hypothetical protein